MSPDDIFLVDVQGDLVKIKKKNVQNNLHHIYDKLWKKSANAQYKQISINQ